MTERPLRILQVSPTDSRGGAEKVAWNLFTAYRSRGHCSWLAVGEKRSSDPGVLLIANEAARGRWYHFWHGLSSRLQRSRRWPRAVAPLSRLTGGLAQAGRRLDFYRGVEDFHFPGSAHLLRLTKQPPDIIHGHNLHGDYFDLRRLPWLSRQAPLLLTLHDAWLLSGHCAHSFTCEKWKTGCGHCPDLTIYPAIRRDATAYNWRRKRDLFARSRLYLATPSAWLMRRVEHSMLAPAVVDARVIPNGVDCRTFRPGDKQAARAALGLAPDATILLAAGIKLQGNIWKEYQTMRQAVFLAAGRRPGSTLLFIALGEDAPPERVGPVDIRFIPYQADVDVVARYYQAADVFVHAARADTFPNTVLEAQACGTPVVATAVGGIPEQIEEGRTGFLTPAGDAQELAGRVAQLLSDDVLRQGMGTDAAAWARSRFDLNQQVDTYLNWYHELVGPGT